MNFLAVTSIALSCAHICARLLQPLAQSLIESPGTLLVTSKMVSIFDMMGVTYVRDLKLPYLNRFLVFTIFGPGWCSNNLMKISR